MLQGKMPANSGNQGCILRKLLRHLLANGSLALNMGLKL